MNGYDNDYIETVNAKIWQVLAEMNNMNHSHEVINALIYSFGHNRVYDKSPWKFGEPELKKIYSILNKHAFDNNLPKYVPIHYGTIDEINKIIKQYDQDNDCLRYGFHGVYYSFYKTFLDGVQLYKTPQSPRYKLTGKEDVEFFNQTIFVDKNVTNGINFMTTVGCMAHEMIHEYVEYFTNEMRMRAILNAFKDVDYDPHTRDPFKEKYIELANLGIDAMQFICGKTNADLNDQTYKLMICEDEILPEVKTIKDKNGQTCLDMRSIPPIDTSNYKEFTVGPCTRMIIYID